MKQIAITIGREYGSGGRIVAQRLAEKLGIPFYDKELISEVAKKTGFTENFIRDAENKRPTNSLLYDLYRSVQVPSIPDQVFIAQARVIRELAEQGSCIIVGRCADYILRDDPSCLKVFIFAPLKERVRRAKEVYGAREDGSNLESFVRRQDKTRASYYNYFSDSKWGDRRTYDLCINSRIGIDTAAGILERTARQMMGDG